MSTADAFKIVLPGTTGGTKPWNMNPLIQDTFITYNYFVATELNSPINVTPNGKCDALH